MDKLSFVSGAVSLVFNIIEVVLTVAVIYWVIHTFV